MLLKSLRSIRVVFVLVISSLAFIYFIPGGRDGLDRAIAGELPRFSRTSSPSDRTSSINDHPNTPNPEQPKLEDPKAVAPAENPAAAQVAESEAQQKVADNLGPWLVSQGITSDVTPIITIADSKYLRALHSLQRRLQQWDRGQHLVVLCLDAACAEDESFRGYPSFIEAKDHKEVMHYIGLLKFRASLELLRKGYNFVFLDGDVYFTGTRDPFVEMLPLSNDTWDMQFQRDMPSPSKALNIGWYFARATSRTIAFFEQSFEKWNEKKDEWDQAVMNRVAVVMENATYSQDPNTPQDHNDKQLRVHRLDMGVFRNFMHIRWENSLFGDENQAVAFINQSTVMHFTCVEQSLKTYMGLNFGGFDDIDGYYSNSPPLIRTANISGTSDAVHRQIAFALQVSAATSRTLIWPDSVSMLQHRKEKVKGKEETKDKEKAEEETEEHDVYEVAPRFPGAMSVNYDTAERAGFSLVEGRYLQNKQRYTQTKHDETIIKVKWLEGLSIGQFEHLITSLRPDVIPVLDFENFGAEWKLSENPGEKDMAVIGTYVKHASASFDLAYHQSGMEAYAKGALEKAPKCGWTDGGNSCLHKC